MIRQPMAWRWHLVLGVASFLTLMAGYTYLSWHRQRLDPSDKTVPNWGQLYREGLLRAVEPDEATGKIRLWEDVQASFTRLFLGLFWSVLLSVSVGLLMGCYAPVEAFLLPPLAFLSKIPGTVMLTIFFVMVGLKDPRLYVVMIAFGVVPTLTQAVYHAAKENVPAELLFKARTLGASQAECIWDVIYKHILPNILEALRLSVGPAMIFLFAMEYVAGQVGLGCTIRLEYKKGAEGAALTYFYLVCLGVFGFAIDSGLRWLQRKLCPWYAS